MMSKTIHIDRTDFVVASGMADINTATAPIDINFTFNAVLIGNGR